MRGDAPRRSLADPAEGEGHKEDQKWDRHADEDRDDQRVLPRCLAVPLSSRLGAVASVSRCSQAVAGGGG